VKRDACHTVHFVGTEAEKNVVVRVSLVAEEQTFTRGHRGFHDCLAPPLIPEKIVITAKNGTAPLLLVSLTSEEIPAVLAHHRTGKSVGTVSHKGWNAHAIVPAEEIRKLGTRDLDFYLMYRGCEVTPWGRGHDPRRAPEFEDCVYRDKWKSHYAAKILAREHRQIRRIRKGKNRTMKTRLSALSLLLLSLTARQVSPDEMKTEDCRIRLPGITFTRSLNEAAAHAKVEDGRITVASEARRDNFRDPNGKFSNSTAPLLLAEVDNKQPFTLTAKVTPTFLKTYDAGALFIYVKEDLWLKMAMEMDERQKTRMVSVRTIGTSDDNNHDVIEAKSVHMKISSDTKTVGFYYSLDTKSWQLIRLFKNDYPPTIWLGISAQSPLGEGTSVLFEDISVTRQSITDFRLGI
jgi:regulation of enolase protein 1 (concanavalin A-like superfamily)